MTVEHDGDQAALPARQCKIVHIDMDAFYAPVDHWLKAHTLVVRKLFVRRSTSRLPALVDRVMTRPIVSAGMIAEEVKITRRATPGFGFWTRGAGDHGARPLPRLGNPLT